MELFATYDRRRQPLGLQPRAYVHQHGLWHMSAQVFVFDPQQRLLVQRRARDKDLYANLWDYSVGEHLKPDESFSDGAHRGLQEELGIVGVALHPLGGERWMELCSSKHIDREIQQAFRCDYDGPLKIDPVEVAEVQYIALDLLKDWIASSPQSFTPWFVEDLIEFKLLD